MWACAYAGFAFNFYYAKFRLSLTSMVLPDLERLACSRMSNELIHKSWLSLRKWNCILICLQIQPLSWSPTIDYQQTTLVGPCAPFALFPFFLFRVGFCLMLPFFCELVYWFVVIKFQIIMMKYLMSGQISSSSHNTTMTTILATSE